MKRYVQNLFSSLFFLWGSYVFYTHQSYFVWFFQWNYTLIPYIEHIFTIQNIFWYFLLIYSFLLALYYIFERGKSKALLIIEYMMQMIRKKSFFLPNTQEKNAILSWCVKIFFVPLMIFWLTWHIFDTTNQLYLLFKPHEISFVQFFSQNIFVAALGMILFFDVFFFTLWYLIEGKIFKNVIKSVEPTLFGWLVALACYPPFNKVTGDLLWWYSSESAHFSHPYALVGFNILILILMGIYAWASVSLGLKASNLTNRWIVKRWPYKYIRHPAYVTKNLAWWIGWVPILVWAILEGKIWLFFTALLSLSAWSGIYYLRSLTEERHLSADEAYLKYKKEVPHMFFPWWKK